MEMFTNAARLQKEPAIIDFAELLTLIAEGFSLRDEGVLSDVLAIYARIGHFVSAKFEASEFVSAMF